MKLNELITKLKKLQEEYGDLEINIMQETDINDHPCQFESELQDLAYCGSRIILIGNELD